MKNEVRWIAGTGQRAMVTIELETSREINLDGDKSTMSCCDMYIRGEIDGQTVGYAIEKITGHPVCVAKIGKLGIKQTEYDLIKKAISEIENTPEWQEKLARIAKSEKESMEYEKHRRFMNKIMSE